MALVRAGGIGGVKLLLNNVMDSISGENRRRLRARFADMAASHGLRLFSPCDGGLREVDLA